MKLKDANFLPVFLVDIFVIYSARLEIRILGMELIWIFEIFEFSRISYFCALRFSE